MGTAASRDENSTDLIDNALPPTAKRQRLEEENGTHPLHDVHAQDARLYNPDAKYQGRDPDPWPKAVYAAFRQVPASDARWEDELSDPLHPITFGTLRLSSSSSGVPPTDEDPYPPGDPDEDQFDPDQAESLRNRVGSRSVTSVSV